MFNAGSNKADLTYLADLAKVPQEPPHRPRDTGIHKWLAHRPNHLPPSVIPDQYIQPTHTTSSASLFPRYGHAVSSPTPDGNVYIFGGRSGPEMYLNDLWLYSTKDQTTTPFQCSGDPPSPRRQAAIFVTGNVLALWGGVIREDYDESLYILDLVSHKWTKIKVHGETPVGRSGHAFATVGSALLIFGGNTGTESQCLNDIWAFDLNSLRSQPAWELIEPSSPIKPSPRLGHRWVLYENQLITFGGLNESPWQYYNDLWSFDLERLRWTEIQYRGHTPSGRYDYAITIVNDVMYIYGGWGRGRILDNFVMFKLSTQQWFDLEHIPPGPRIVQNMVSMDTLIFVLGGRSHDGLEDDLVYVLHTAKPVEEMNIRTWEEATKEKGGIDRGKEDKRTRNGEEAEMRAQDTNASEGRTKLRNDHEQTTDRIFPAFIRSRSGQGQEDLYSKFLLEGVHENPATEVEESWKFSINTDITMSSFHSRGADQNPPEQLLQGTYQSMDQFAGFDGFNGNIGNGKFYLRTDRGVVVKGEIVGGPRSGQSFTGAGTWYKA